MKIGIKYGGGCNPTFNRMQFVKLLNKEFAEIIFENVDINICYDLIIVICGCARACANSIDYKYMQILYVTKETDFSSVKSTILELYSI